MKLTIEQVHKIYPASDIRVWYRGSISGKWHAAFGDCYNDDIADDADSPEEALGKFVTLKLKRADEDVVTLTEQLRRARETADTLRRAIEEAAR